MGISGKIKKLKKKKENAAVKSRLEYVEFYALNLTRVLLTISVFLVNMKDRGNLKLDNPEDEESYNTIQKVLDDIFKDAVQEPEKEDEGSK